MQYAKSWQIILADRKTYRYSCSCVCNVDLMTLKLLYSHCRPSRVCHLYDATGLLTVTGSLFLFCRFLYICVPLCGEGKCAEAVEDLPVLRQNETSRELRLHTFHFTILLSDSFRIFTHITHISHMWLCTWFLIPLNMDSRLECFRCTMMVINHTSNSGWLCQISSCLISPLSCKISSTEWSRTATQKTVKKLSMTRITSLHSSKSSQSNNSSSSSSFLVSDSSELNGIGKQRQSAIVIVLSTHCKLLFVKVLLEKLFARKC